MRKIPKKLLAVFLALVTVFQLSYTGYAEPEASGELYISDVRVETDTDAAAAKKRLTDAGYTVYDQNLNEGNSGYSYIGYKTTLNPDEGITKISAMNMNGGYENMTYREVISSQMDGLQSTASLILSACRRMAENYALGKRNAVLAVTVLNAYEIDGVPFGNYLIDSGRTVDELVDIILICDTAVISALYNQLSIGVADDTASGEDSWMQKLSNAGPLNFSDYADEEGNVTEADVEAAYTDKYDGLYYSAAKNVWSSVQVFSEKYKDALTRHPDGRYTLAEAGLEESTSGSSEEELQEAKENVLSDLSGDTSDADDDYRYLALYSMLSQKNEDGKAVYPYGTKEDGTEKTLGEFFVEIGSADQNDAAAMKNAYRLLYPLVMTLTSEQAVMLRFSGFVTSCLADMYTEETLQSAYDSFNEIFSRMQADGISSISVWIGINRSIYDETVGVTSAAYRSIASANNYSMLTKAEPDKYYTESVNLYRSYAMLIAGSAIAAVVLVCLIAVAIGVGMGMGFAALSVSTMVSVIYLGGFSVLMGGTSALAMGATICAVAGAVIVVLTVVALIVALVFWILSFFWDEDEEAPQAAEINYTTIPKKLYDYVDDDTCSLFQVVTNVAGEAQDINLFSQNEWVALYTSTDSRYGGPIIAPNSGDPAAFICDKGTYSPREGYSPLAFFGEKQAANLNYGSKNDITGIFISYNKGAEKESADTTVSQGKYIKDVILKSEYSPEAAKLAIKNEGYTLVDYNLTPSTNDFVKKYVNRDEYEEKPIYTYIGYTTTDDSTKAVTDLRISYSSGVSGKGGSQMYGLSSYGVCGYVNDMLLFQTKSSLAGSPILANGFHITTSVAEKADGEEGINLFSGGIAFDFQSAGNCSLDGRGGKGKSYQTGAGGVYVFFTPETQYKSSDTGAVKYLGGLQFFYGTEGDVANQAERDGYVAIQGSGNILYTYQDKVVRLYASFTYNPFRAISGITAYEAEPDCQAVQYSFSSGGVSYVACDVRGVSGDCQYLFRTHSYTSNSYYEMGSYFSSLAESDTGDEANPLYNFEDFVFNLLTEGGNLTTWTYSTDFFKDSFPMAFYDYNGETVMSSYREKALYITGYTGGEPIRFDCLQSSEELLSPSSYTPVRSVRDWYSEEPENLCFNDVFNSGKYYLYMTGAANTRGKYIASVTVKFNSGTVNGEDYPNPYDASIFALQSNGPGTLLEMNLSSGDDSAWYESYFPEETYEYFHSEYRNSKWITATKDYRRFNPSYVKTVAYIWITYTDNVLESVCDLVLKEVGDGKASNYVTDTEDIRYERCGDTFLEKSTGKYYAIYATDAGNPVTDIQVDNFPMSAGYSTVIDTSGVISGYQSSFIKIKNEANTKRKNYVKQITVGEGTDDYSAQISLLSKGCRCFVPFNISPALNSSAYVGISYTGTCYSAKLGINAFTGLIMEDTGQDQTIKSVTYKRYVYNRISENLNGDTYDAAIYLFASREAGLAKKNGAKNLKQGRYVEDIGFFNGLDLNKYADDPSLIDSLPENLREYVRSLVVDSDGSAKYWVIVRSSDNSIINVNRGAYEAEGVSGKVYMYVHYSDNYYTATALVGSIFESLSSYYFVLGLLLILILTGAGIAIIRKRKKIRSGF